MKCYTIITSLLPKVLSAQYVCFYELCHPASVLLPVSIALHLTTASLYSMLNKAWAHARCDNNICTYVNYIY